MHRVTTFTAAAVGALTLGMAAPTLAAPPGGPDGYEAPTGCVAGAASNFDISITDDGDVHLVFHDDGLATCNETVHVQSWASDGLTVDVYSAPPLGDAFPTMAELEQAGPAGLTVPMPIDPCYTAFTVLRDGDTLVHEEIIGDGCDLTIEVDYTGIGHSATFHVVQQTGPIQPPHIFTVGADSTTVLTGLPNGTWYVKVYDGWTKGSRIMTVGQEVNTWGVIHGVPANGSVFAELAPEPIDWFVTPIAASELPVLPGPCCVRTVSDVIAVELDAPRIEPLQVAERIGR